MHDQIIPEPPSENPPDPPVGPNANPTETPARRFRRATGPTSAQGKAISSMNRLSHGCRSQQTILPDEDPAEFQATMDAWLETYGPQDEVAARLVEEAALADWFLRRNRKRLGQIERRLPKDAWLWTDEHQKLYSNFMRYKTTAERSFIRAFRELEAHVRRDAQDARLEARALAQSARIFLQWMARTEETVSDKLRIRQWIDIERTGSSTRTSCFPTNQQIYQRIAALPEPPCFVTRLLNFPRGVPPEYAWAFPDRVQQFAPGTARQTMFYPDWLRVVEREKSNPGGHIGPIDWLFDD